MKLRCILIIICVLAAVSQPAYSVEKIGEFSIKAIQLRPTWISHERDGANFSLADSSAELSWTKDKKVSVHMGLGSTLERNLPVYYSAPNDEEFGFYEMYAEYSGIYGRARFGLIPLYFGYDGLIPNYERLFNRALPYTQRAIGLRDFGFSFYTENKGYYTEIIAHNGEVDTTSDGRIWTTGRWGYDGSRDLRVQLSLQTGYVKGSVSSGNAANTLGGVANGSSAKWRNGLLFLNWYSRKWNIVAQYGGGEFVQGDDDGSFASQTLEVMHYPFRQFGVGFKYDEFDPNHDLANDKITEYSLIFAGKSIDTTSQFYILGTQVTEEGRKVPNDQVRLVWLLTPYAR